MSSKRAGADKAVKPPAVEISAVNGTENKSMVELPPAAPRIFDALDMINTTPALADASQSSAATLLSPSALAPAALVEMRSVVFSSVSYRNTSTFEFSSSFAKNSSPD